MIKGIVAINPEMVIGTSTNEMPWYLPEDLKRFKELTIGSTLLCGRKTFDSLGGKPLGGRDFIVLSRQKHPPRIPRVKWIKRPIEIFNEKSWTKDDLWVIGGAEVFKAMLPVIDKMYVTLVFKDVEDGKIVLPSNIFELYNNIEYGDIYTSTEGMQYQYRVYSKQKI